MLEEIPYTARVAVLIILMATMAAVDYLRQRDGAIRWKEYTLALTAGLTGH